MSPPPNTLPTPSRYITTHHPQNGTSVLSDAIPAPAKWQHLKGAQASFFLAYCTDTFPVDLSTPETPGRTAPPETSRGAEAGLEEPLPKDVQTYKGYLASPPGLTLSGGTVLRYVDMAPGHVSPMHRTVSLDYGIVVEGEVELVLDGGETRVLKRGDVAVQRATAHAWRNTSETEWARMVFVLVPCGELELAGGRRIGEDLGGMEGVRGSD